MSQPTPLSLTRSPFTVLTKVVHGLTLAPLINFSKDLPLRFSRQMKKNSLATKQLMAGFFLSYLFKPLLRNSPTLNVILLINPTMLRRIAHLILLDWWPHKKLSYMANTKIFQVLDNCTNNAIQFIFGSSILERAFAVPSIMMSMARGYIHLSELSSKHQNNDLFTIRLRVGSVALEAFNLLIISIHWTLLKLSTSSEHHEPNSSTLSDENYRTPLSKINSAWKHQLTALVCEGLFFCFPLFVEISKWPIDNRIIKTFHLTKSLTRVFYANP